MNKRLATLLGFISSGFLAISASEAGTFTYRANGEQKAMEVRDDTVAVQKTETKTANQRLLDVAKTDGSRSIIQVKGSKSFASASASVASSLSGFVSPVLVDSAGNDA